MGVTLNASGVREYQDGSQVTTGDTFIELQYTKKDPRVVVLTIELRDSGNNLISSVDIDVSNQNQDTTETYTARLSNGLSPLSVVASETTVTVQAGQSVTYSPQTGKIAVVLAGVAGVEVIDSKERNWGFTNVVVPDGETITLNNPTATQATVTIYEIDENQVNATFNLVFREKDANGNELWSYIISITDVAPLIITVAEEGAVIIQAIG